MVGSNEPQNCKTVRGCCYAQHWRVSLLRQAGFPTHAVTDGCSTRADVTYIDPTTLTFSIDTQLTQIADCSINNATQTCKLTVSLIDTLQWGSPPKPSSFTPPPGSLPRIQPVHPSGLLHC